MRVNMNIVEMNLPNHHHTFLVVSQFTVGTPYEDEIKDLKQSMNKFNIPFLIYSYESLGTWRANCNATVFIVLETLMDFPQYNIVFIDADAIFHEYPILFEKLDCDIAAYKRKNSEGYILKHKCNKGYHWETGTIFYRNNERVHAFLENQLRIMDEVSTSKSNESYMTNDLLENTDLIIGELPISYSKIIGTVQPEEIDIKPVISHKLHGYKYRKSIDD